MSQNDKYFAIYSRKSKYTGVGESIQNQIDSSKRLLLSKYPNAEESQIRIFEDEGFSGGNTKRPAFQKMLKLLQEDKLYCIVAYRLDRISRSVIDFVDLLKIIDAHHTELHLVNDNYDIDSYTGRSMLMIASIFAEMERNIIRERITDNLLGLAKTGRWLGGTTPTGYCSVDTNKDNHAKMLQLIPDQADTVRLLFSKYLELQSLTGLETYCLQHGILTKTGKPHTRISLQTILSNAVYCTADLQAKKYFETLNCMIYNTDEEKTLNDLFDGQHAMLIYRKLDENGTTYKMNSPEEWIVTVGKHEPIVSSKEWIEAQEIMKRNSSKSYRQPHKGAGTALLSSLLHCAHCGGYMRPQTSKRINKYGELSYRYICELSYKSKKACCPCVSVNGNLLDQQVMEEILHLSSEKSTLMLDLQTMLETSQSSSDLHLQIKEIEHRNAKLEREIQKLISNMAAVEEESIVKDISQAITERKQMITDNDSRLQELNALLSTQDQESKSIDELIQYLTDFPALLADANFDQKRSALRKIIQSVYYDYEKKMITINLMGASSATNVYLPEKYQMRSSCTSVPGRSI